MVYILLLFCFQPICVFDSKFLARLISEVIDIWASDMQMIPPLWQKVKKNWRALIKVKEESETVGFGNLIKKIKYTFILNWDLTKKIILVFVLKWIVLLNKLLKFHRKKINIQKTKIMASSPITSWQTNGETVTDFIFFWLQNHCRWWLQPWN